jgi:DNA adenine methylase
VNSPEPRARPFLKWAGGKTKLLETLTGLLPASISTYYEPFLGGGALFFHLFGLRRFKMAVLGDSNPELINCYEVIRDETDALIEQLGTLPVEEAFFYDLRSTQTAELSAVPRAARTIYLNRTCFNGLFRLNKKGQFNTPWGKYTNPRIVDPDNLRACSIALGRASTTLAAGDFTRLVQPAQAGDVVYFDPPYVPLTATANFKSYTQEGFTLDDQKRLAQCFKDLASRGVHVIASNADVPVVRELYDGFDTHTVPVPRRINSKGDSRGPVNEVIVVGGSRLSTAPGPRGPDAPDATPL